MGYLGNEPADVAVTVGQGVIDASHIQDSSITTADLGNDAVTPNKIDDDGTGFQMGSLGLGGAVSGSDKLTVSGATTITGAGLNASPNLAIDNTSSSSYIHSIEALGANMTAGQTNIINLGKIGDSKNSGVIGYKWNGAGSNDNLLTFEHWGTGALQTIDGLGNVTFLGNGSDQTTKWHSGSAYVNAKLDVRQLAIAFSGTDKVTSDTSGNFTFSGLTHLKGSAWNSILRLGDTSRSEQLTHINNGTVNFSIYTSNGTKGVITANHDGSAMTLGADYTSGALTVYPPTTFTNHVTIDGVGHPVLKLVGDASAGESTHLQLHRSNGHGFTIYDTGSALAFRSDTSSNDQMLQLANSNQAATFYGDVTISKSNAKMTIFASNTGDHESLVFDRNTASNGDSQEIRWKLQGNNYPGGYILHEFSDANNSSMAFGVRDSGTPATALSINSSRDVTVAKRLYVTANLDGNFGTELFNASSTGHGTKIRGGSSSSHYALFVSNHNQTGGSLFQVLGDGKCQTGSELTIGMNSTGFSAVKGSASVQLVNGGSINVTTGDNQFIMLSENTLGRGALFHCTYPQATPNRMSDPNSIYSASDTANHVCVFSSANSSTTTIKNNMGSTLNFRIIVFGV